MKGLIYILTIIVLFSCSAGEMNAEYAKVAQEPMADMVKGKALSQAELDEYISIKLQDVMELQELLFNPEIDQEMKAYAADMILKIVPDENLLNKKYRITQYNLYKQAFKGNGDTKLLTTYLSLQIPDSIINLRVTTLNEEGDVKIQYKSAD